MTVLRQMMARDPGGPNHAATQLELFFDLVRLIALASATAAFHHAFSYGHRPDLLLNFCLNDRSDLVAMGEPYVVCIRLRQ